MKNFRLVLLVVILLTACVSSPSSVTTGPASGQQANPVSQTTPSGSSAYPAPASNSSVSAPTSIPGTATVRGRLLLNGKPVTNGNMYLSEIIKDETGREMSVGFSRQSGVKSGLDSNGNFVVVNVPPGRYGLVYDVIVDAVLLMKPGKDESFIFDVPAGKEVNLGDLNYPTLPGSGQ